MKQQIAHILRKTGLIYLVDYARFAVMRLRNAARNKTFLQQHAEEAFPPPYMIYETFRLDYQRYFLSGRETAIWIIREVNALKDIRGWNILDWGCGPGRVIRHMRTTAGNDHHFFGCDYNPAYINWCAAHIPGVSFRKNELDPPLPYGDQSMNLIYGLSIFTHLSAAKHSEWIAELLRVLQPGGILFITTHGDITRENLIPEELEQYNRGELVTRANVKEGHRMYVAYHPPAFMQQLFKDKAKVLSHQPGQKQSWGLQQDLWIVEKL